MPTLGEIKKAIAVLSAIDEGGHLHVCAEPNMGELNVTDICISERHGALGINICVDVEPLLEPLADKD